MSYLEPTPQFGVYTQIVDSDTVHVLCVFGPEPKVLHEYYDFGTTTAGPDGNWNLTAVMPGTANSSDGAPVATPGGTWKVTALGSDSRNNYMPQVADLEIADCGSALPETGTPVFFYLYLAGALGGAVLLPMIVRQRAARA
jgi:hypothetical protein